MELAIAHRSVSQLGQYTRCSEQYRLSRVVQGLPERPSAWLAVGSAFHEAYEQWERGERRYNLHTLFYSRYLDEISRLQRLQPDMNWWIKTPRCKSVESDIDARGKHGIKQAIAYQESCEQSPWKVAKTPDGVLALELDFSLRLRGLEIKGAVDSVLEWPDGRQSIRDLKTGNVGSEPDNRQLGTYRVAMNELYGFNIGYGENWFTKVGHSGGFQDLTRYTRPYLEDQYNKLDLAIKNDIFLPNPGPHCGMCDRRLWCRDKGTDPK